MKVIGDEPANTDYHPGLRERADALVVQGDLAIKPVADMAIKYRLPAASTTRFVIVSE